MKELLYTMIFLIAFSGFAQKDSAKAVIEPAQYKEQIQKEKILLIDVRTAKEYAEGHIEGAENINFHSEDFLSQFNKFNKEQPLYIYCRSGNRSGKAAEKLLQKGFRVIDLKGGYLAWEQFLKE